jgi:hypothetical protein
MTAEEIRALGNFSVGRFENEPKHLTDAQAIELWQVAMLREIAAQLAEINTRLYQLVMKK